MEAPPPRGHGDLMGFGDQIVATRHVTADAGVEAAAICAAKDAVLPFLKRPFKMDTSSRHDVVARPAQLTGGREIAIVHGRVGDCVCAGAPGVGDATTHGLVVRQAQRVVGRDLQWVVVLGGDRFHVVAEVAGDAFVLGGYLVQVETVLREAERDGHRCVAGNTEVAQFPAGLLMAAKTGSSAAYACMLADHSRTCLGWHDRQVSGSWSISNGDPPTTISPSAASPSWAQPVSNAANRAVATTLECTRPPRPRRSCPRCRL